MWFNSTGVSPAARRLMQICVGCTTGRVSLLGGRRVHLTPRAPCFVCECARELQRSRGESEAPLVIYLCDPLWENTMSPESLSATSSAPSVRGAAGKRCSRTSVPARRLLGFFFSPFLPEVYVHRQTNWQRRRRTTPVSSSGYTVRNPVLPGRRSSPQPLPHSKCERDLKERRAKKKRSLCFLFNRTLLDGCDRTIPLPNDSRCLGWGSLFRQPDSGLRLSFRGLLQEMGRKLSMWPRWGEGETRVKHSLTRSAHCRRVQCSVAC